MNGVGRYIKARKRVVMKSAMGFEDIPFELTDSVTTLSFVDGSKFERTMDECVRMSEVDIYEGGGVCVDQRRFQMNQ